MISPGVHITGGNKYLLTDRHAHKLSVEGILNVSIRGKPLKTRNEDKREADCLHYMRWNAYYNVGFDLFYLSKKRFIHFFEELCMKYVRSVKMLKIAKWKQEMTGTCTIFRFLNYFRSVKKVIIIFHLEYIFNEIKHN